MVKASAEVSIHGKTMFFGNISTNYKEEVKSKTPFIKRWLFSGKGRRKEKDTPLNTPEENKPYLEEDFVQEKITDSEIHSLVQLPQGLDLNEWLATHTISFFEHINLLYGTVSEYCTSTGCSSMTAPGNTQYLWVDEKGKKCKCAAPQYVEYVMTYTQKTIHDESTFPTKYGNVFPACFESTVKKLHRWLFHVIAHLYQSHYKEIYALSLAPHLNTIFQHFMCFNKTFNLMDDKETEVLLDLYNKMECIAVQKKLNVNADGSVSKSPEEDDPQTKDSGVGPSGDSEENKENVSENQQSQQQPQPQTSSST